MGQGGPKYCVQRMKGLKRKKVRAGIDSSMDRQGSRSCPEFGRVSSLRIWEPAKSESSDAKYLSHAARTKSYRHECTQGWGSLRV